MGAATVLLSPTVVQLQNRFQQRTCVDAYQHHSVAEPLGYADPAARTDVAQECPEGGEDVDRALVSLHHGQGGEPGDVDEPECPVHAHALIVPCRPSAGPIRARQGKP